MRFTVNNFDNRSLFGFVVFVAWSTGGLHAAQFFVDTIPVAAGSNYFSPSNGTGRVFKGQLIFRANGTLGEEVYAYDGNEIRLLADLKAGAGSSYPDFSNSAQFQGNLYFGAADSFYKFDGSMVQKFDDLAPAGKPLEVNDKLFYVTHGADGRELRITDGTTVTAFDLYPGAIGSNPEPLYRFGDEVFFQATGVEGRGLYKTNGMTVENLHILAPSTYEFIEMGGDLYLTGASSSGNGVELHRYDGVNLTEIDVNPGAGGSLPRSFGVFGDKLLFNADGPTGRELAVWDGNQVERFDLRIGTNGSNPSGFTIVEDSVYFEAHLGPVGAPGDIFRYQNGTVTPLNISSQVGVVDFSFYDNGGTGVIGDVMLFAGDGSYGHELYRVQGNEVRLLQDIIPGGDTISGDAFFLTFSGFFDNSDGTLGFSVHTLPPSQQAYVTDGNVAWPRKVLEGVVGLPDQARLYVEADVAGSQLVRAVSEHGTQLYEVRQGVATELLAFGGVNHFNPTISRAFSFNDQWIVVGGQGDLPGERVYYRIQLVPEPVLGPLVLMAFVFCAIKGKRLS
jgi:ELWxxDGT repeat protein